MAKTERMTKKEVLKMFEDVNFHEHFKGTGMTESDVKKFVDDYNIRLSEKKLDEASEREIIDELTRDLGDIFKKDISAVNRRLMNAQFEYARAITGRQKAEALVAIFEDAKKEYQDAEEQGAKDANAEAIAKREAADSGYRTAEDKTAEMARLREDRNAKLAEITERQNARDTAIQQDTDQWYIEHYEEEFKSGLGFFKKMRYPKDPAARAAQIREWVDQKIAEQRKTEVMESGEINTSTTLATKYTHYVYDPKTPGPLENAINLRIAELRGAIAAIDNNTARFEAERVDSVAHAGVYAKAAEQASKVVEAYNEEIRELNGNIQAMGFARDGARMNEEIIKLDTLESKLELAQRILEEELQDANPLLQLAYEGYIAQIKERERIADEFKSDASEELDAIMRRDFAQNDENYMERALEHYIAAGFGGSDYEFQLENLRKKTQKYFKKYVPNLEAKYEEITTRYRVVANSFDYFARDVLGTEYVGKNSTTRFDREIEKEIADNSALLDARVGASRKANQLEIISPDYDRIARLTAIPNVKEYMALTMMREEIIKEKTAAGKAGLKLPEDRALKLAEIAKRLEACIDVAKRDGTIMDLSEATQVAVESLIPGYDQVAAFAKLHGKDLNNPQDRAVLQRMQETFVAERVVSEATVEDIMAYAQFMGADIYDAQGNVDATKREAFVKSNMKDMAKFFTQTGPSYSAKIQPWVNDLTSGKLAGDPQAIADMYNAYGNAGLRVAFEDGRLTIAAEGQIPVEVSAERLLDPAFMQSVGMTITLDPAKVANYRKVVDATPVIKDSLEVRESYSYVQVDGKDWGILGQAGVFVGSNVEMWFEGEKQKLHDLMKDPKAMAASMGQGVKADDYAAMTAEYKRRYAELLTEYAEMKEVYTKMNDKEEDLAATVDLEELSTPIEHRETDPRLKDHSELYDEGLKTVDKADKKLFRNGKARTKTIVDKVLAIDKARAEFAQSDEVANELLNEGIALSVIEMLETLEEIRVSNPTVIEVLNQAIIDARKAQALAEGRELTDEDALAIHMDEEKKLGVSVGDHTYSVEDGKVKIEERQSTNEQTVSEVEQGQ